MNIALRELQLEDLNDYLNLNHPEKEFHKFNAPYFPKENLFQLQIRIQKLKDNFLNDSNEIFKNKKLIINKDNKEIIGEVSWYWKSQETFWMEIGIIIFNENYRNKGIGYQALKLWTNEIFINFPEIIRLGFTTWSGNIGMIKLAEKLNFIKEAEYRKARIINNEYFDSLSYGILRNEWIDLN